LRLGLQGWGKGCGSSQRAFVETHALEVVRRVVGKSTKVAKSSGASVAGMAWSAQLEKPQSPGPNFAPHWLHHVSANRTPLDFSAAS